MKDLDRKLRSLGQAPAPEPGAAFAERLEQRLRAIPLAEPGRAGARRPAAPRWAPATALLAAVAAITAVLMLATPDGGEVEVNTATDAFVVLPDGLVEGVEAGQVVPDGSVVKTGEEGSLTAGGVALGPNAEAVVEEGTLVTAPPAARPVIAPPTVPPTSPPIATPDTSSVTSVAEPTTTTTTKPPPQPVTSTPAEPGPAPTKQQPDEPRRDVATLRLEAQSHDNAVMLRWSRYQGKAFAAYLVLRADAPAAPQYPVDDRTMVLARVTDPGWTMFKDKEGPRPRYRIVAVTEDGRLLASSEVVAPSGALRTQSQSHDSR